LVTTTFTAPAACAGVVAVICVALTTTTFVAPAPPNVTVAPVAKFVPVMVTAVPPAVGPLFGLTPVTVGTPPEVTVSVAVVWWLRLPVVPVIVRLERPTGVLPAVVTVNVEEPVPVTVVGKKLAVAPAGRPVTLRLTVPLKPSRAVTFTV